MPYKNPPKKMRFKAGVSGNLLGRPMNIRMPPWWMQLKTFDWKCARFIKPDQPLNAYETMQKYYPQMAPHLVPTMKELGLS